jgi:hypothetical protein
VVCCARPRNRGLTGRGTNLGANCRGSAICFFSGGSFDRPRGIVSGSWMRISASHCKTSSPSKASVATEAFFIRPLLTPLAIYKTCRDVLLNLYGTAHHVVRSRHFSTRPIPRWIPVRSTSRSVTCPLCGNDGSVVWDKTGYDKRPTRVSEGFRAGPSGVIYCAACGARSQGNSNKRTRSFQNHQSRQANFAETAVRLTTSLRWSPREAGFDKARGTRRDWPNADEVDG